MTKPYPTLCAALVLGGAAIATAQEAPQRLQTIQLQAGMHLIRAEVAATPAQRQTGLMFRRDLHPDLRADWRYDRDWTAGVRVNNLTGKPYETAYGFNQPGRAMFVTLRWAPPARR